MPAISVPHLYDQSRDEDVIDSIEGATSQRMSVDLEDCQCVRCRAPVLLVADPNPDTIIRSAIKCSICNAEYDLIWGVPFLARTTAKTSPG